MIAKPSSRLDFWSRVLEHRFPNLEGCGVILSSRLVRVWHSATQFQGVWPSSTRTFCENLVFEGRPVPIAVRWCWRLMSGRVCQSRRGHEYDVIMMFRPGGRTSRIITSLSIQNLTNCTNNRVFFQWICSGTGRPPKHSLAWNCWDRCPNKKGGTTCARNSMVHHRSAEQNNIEPMKKPMVVSIWNNRVGCTSSDQDWPQALDSFRSSRLSLLQDWGVNYFDPVSRASLLLRRKSHPLWNRVRFVDGGRHWIRTKWWRELRESKAHNK